jgi:purine-binding chemotaxis protein CheW
MKQLKTKDNKVRSPIDWEGIRKKIELTTARILENGDELKTQDKVKIFKARAKNLARETDDEKKGITGETLDIIEFLLDDERYGIEASYIREIYPLKELVFIPGTPSFILGITNVRGKILSIIDIKKLFGLPPKGLSELDKVIIVKNGAMELGIHADSVIGMRSIANEELQPPLTTLTGVCAKYLKGITGEQIAILDIKELLSDKNIIVNEEVEI